MRLLLALLLAALAPSSLIAQPKNVEPFFPMAVWYGGGKARAPMLEEDPEAKVEIWRKDVKQIRALGFNTMRAWVDWASAEPREGKYDFRHAGRPRAPGGGGRAAAGDPGVRGLGARLGRQEVS